MSKKHKPDARPRRMTIIHSYFVMGLMDYKKLSHDLKQEPKGRLQTLFPGFVFPYSRRMPTVAGLMSFCGFPPLIGSKGIEGIWFSEAGGGRFLDDMLFAYLAPYVPSGCEITVSCCCGCRGITLYRFHEGDCLKYEGGEITYPTAPKELRGISFAVMAERMEKGGRY